jgi:tetratricopeptide (TPR) repeat protein
MVNPPRSGPRRFRAALIFLLLAAVALVVAPVGRHALISFDLYRARRALEDVNFELASDWLQAAERRQPERGDVQYWLAVTYRRHAQYRRAIERLQRAEALGWPKSDLERQRKMILFQQGDVTQSEPYLKKLLELGVSDDVAEDVYESMSIGYLAEHRLDDAALCLKYWIEWRPNSLRAWLLRAHFQSVVAPHSERLEADLREVLRISPGRVAERLALAELLLRQMRVDEALDECETCRRQAPDDRRVQMGFGLCHHRQGRLEEAKRELESAVTPARAGEPGLDPDALTRALTTLGQIASSTRDFESAARYYKEAVKQAPHDPGAAYGLGTTLKMLGDDVRAGPYLQRSQTLMSQSERLSEIRVALGKDPTNLALRVETATILLDQGRKAEAAGWMTSALYHEPTLRVAHEFLADFFDEQGASELGQRHREAARNGTEMAGADSPRSARTNYGN